jgi:hypothetical protein
MSCETIFSFGVLIDGKPFTATVINEEGEGRDFYYRVQFSDGYEDVFHEENGEMVGLRGDTSKPYSDAIKYDVHHYIGLNSDNFWDVFPYEMDGEKINIWIFEEEDEDEQENLSTSWNVHYKKEYRFHMMNVGGIWMVSNRNGKDIPAIDRELSKTVEHYLKTVL